SETSGLDPATLRAALREAVASHLVVAQPDDRYTFRHALLREVVVDDLLPGERTDLHRGLAEALERRADKAPADAQLLAGIAHHYAAAGDQPAALATSVRAAVAADAVHAHGEAAALLERALDLWDRVPDAGRALELVQGGEPSPERAAILAWWAKTRMLQGRYRDAARAARDALHAAEATDNRAALSAALNAMGVALAAQGAVDEGTAALRRAIDIAREHDRSIEIESAEVNLADALHMAGRSREALDVVRTARGESRQMGYRVNWLDAVISELA